MNENLKPVEKLTPFTKMIMTIGTLPSSFYASMSYYESMVWLYEYLKNEVIPAVNNNGEAVEELQTAFITLKDWIENYFENLDVQEEINHKLDEMALDGTLTNLIKAYIDPLYQAYEESINHSIDTMEDNIDDMQEEISTFKQSTTTQLNTIASEVESASSGSPKGVYSTLTALTTADPSHDYIYVVAEDGKWYYYDTSTTSWKAGGVYQASVDGDTTNLLNSLVVNGGLKNQVIREDWLYNKGYSGNTSSVVDTTSWVLTNRIPCTSGTKISGDMGYHDIIYYMKVSNSKIAYYDENNDWVETLETPSLVVDDEYTFTRTGTFVLQLNKALLPWSTLNELLISNLPCEIFTDEIEKLINSNKVIDPIYDIILFMGQSNMAGRGSTNASHPDSYPRSNYNMNYEFRAISDPTKLYPIEEPFGYAENDPDGIDDGTSKTGSSVVSICNNYTKYCGHHIIAISASEGGSASQFWTPGSANLTDAINRLNLCKQYCLDNHIKYEKIYAVWCQGESDGDLNIPKQTYKLNVLNMLNSLIANGVNKLFLIRIGEYNGSTEGIDYSTIISAQTELGQDYKNIVLISTKFDEMKDKGYMKDAFHYYQDAYNIVGEQAGTNMAYFINRNKRPTMYDYKNNDLFYSKVGN